MQHNLSDTIVALATPPGTGAIAVIRLSGPRAIIIADGVFRGKRLENQPSHTAHFGRLENEAGRAIDEVLATLFRAPKSYTGEEVVEFSVHGSPYIQQEVLQLLLDKGARLAQPGEFTLRAFLNGKMDLSQAEAVADLIASESEAAHSVALRQLRGGFKNEIQNLREELVHFASLVELELDFSEEDVEFADRDALRKLVEKIRRYVQQLLQSFTLGNVLKTGVSTVIAGRPNAGKSTLLNALLNEERAIVSDIAGTTRDTIEEVLNIGGVQFRLVDTAGIREAQDTIEAIGVERTLEKIQQASVLVYVWDVTGMTLAELYKDLNSLHTPGMKTLVVCNKMDRNPHFDPDWLLNPSSPEVFPYLTEDAQPEELTSPEWLQEPGSIVTLSAKNEQNIGYLKERLLELALGGSLKLESTVVTNARHFEALQKTDRSLGDVLQGLDTGITGDFIAQDIRHALNSLGEITGEIGVEDLLGNIFGKFCIGK
ncbi:MAG: tRNA uridine-5-carboxymethylaminomethyl(34) synthesis GTPase MnmE [Saprospiraceae bacterium]